MFVPFSHQSLISLLPIKILKIINYYSRILSWFSSKFSELRTKFTYGNQEWEYFKFVRVNSEYCVVQITFKNNHFNYSIGIYIHKEIFRVFILYHKRISPEGNVNIVCYETNANLWILFLLVTMSTELFNGRFVSQKLYFFRTKSLRWCSILLLRFLK